MDNKFLCEIADVEYDEAGKKVTFICLNEEKTKIYEVIRNKQQRNKKINKFVDGKEKAEQCEKRAAEYFNLSFDELENAVGKKLTVYVYDNFNSFREVDIIEKFNEEMTDGFYQTEIKKIYEDERGIHAQYEINGKTYQTNRNVLQYVEALDRRIENPQNKQRKYRKFEKLFGISPKHAEVLKGAKIAVEVKRFGQYFFGDIKALSAKDKEKYKKLVKEA